MKDIGFNCPHCAVAIVAPPESAGTVGECPSCGKEVSVPRILPKDIAPTKPNRTTMKSISAVKARPRVATGLQQSLTVSPHPKVVKVIRANQQKLTFSCQHCGHGLEAALSAIGTVVKCTECKSNTKVRRKVSASSIALARSVSQSGRHSESATGQRPQVDSEGLSSGLEALLDTFLDV